jgi:hypothetical protein
MVRHQADSFWTHDGVQCIASVPSPRFGGAHAVIVEFNCGDVKLIHDPHPSNDGFEGDPRFYYFLIANPAHCVAAATRRCAEMLETEGVMLAIVPGETKHDHVIRFARAFAAKIRTKFKLEPTR